jgi:RHS repeat-associated protein
MLFFVFDEDSAMYSGERGELMRHARSSFKRNVLTLFVGLLLILLSGHGDHRIGSQEQNLFPPNELTSSIEITPQQPIAGAGLYFQISLKDGSGQPLYPTKSQIQAYLNNQLVRCYAAPPALDSNVEKENKTAIKEKRYDDLRYNIWSYCVPKTMASGSLSFGVIVTIDGKTYKNLFTKEGTAGRAARSAAPSVQGGVLDNMPPVGYYGTGVADLSLNSREYKPGDLVVATINLKSDYWCLWADISCSFADPDNIKIDGQRVPREQVQANRNAAYYWRWTLPQEQPVPMPPTYMVTIPRNPNGNVGQHTVEFKLDCNAADKYFTKDPDAYGGAGAYIGPFVSVGAEFGWTEWDADEGFVITNWEQAEYYSGIDSSHEPIHCGCPCKGGSEGSNLIDSSNGNNVLQADDIQVNCLGPSLSFSRAYSSRWNYNGPMGYGWTHSYNTSLKEESDGSVTETDEIGTIYRYTIAGAGAYSAPPGRNTALVKNADGTFTLTEKNLLKKKFSGEGKLLSLTDENNNSMVMTYESGKLTKIIDASGRETLLTYSPDGKISKIVDPAQRKVEYFYESDNLVRVNDITGLDTQYLYDSTHHLIQVTSFDGQKSHFTYDTQGKLLTQTYHGEETTGIAYDPATRTTVVTDKMGNQTTIKMDEKGRMISKSDPYGAETRYEWDQNNNITKIVDPRGGVQEFTFDPRGNMLTHKDQMDAITTYTYSDKNQVTSIRDALNKTRQLLYDTRGNLVKEVDFQGTTVASYGYNDKGLRTSMSDALGHTWRYEFDQYANLVKEIDPYGHETRKTYDSVDRMLTSTNQKGKTTSYTYGVRDQIIKITYPDQTTSRYDWYPCCAYLKAVVDAKLNGIGYFYDSKRRLTKVVDAANGAVTFEYDENNNRTAIVDQKSSRTSLAYDKVDRLTRIDYPDGTSESFTYFPDGLLKTKTDGNGAVTTFEYDPAGRLTKKIYADGSIDEFSLDAVGKRLSMKDSTGTYAYQYNDLYQLTGVTLPSGKSIAYSYNVQGLRVGMTDYNHKNYGYSYDKMNRLERLTLPGAEKIEYNYDVLSNVAKVCYPNGTYSAYSYSDMNRLTKISTMKKGFRGKLISEFEYGYDEVGNRVSMNEHQLFGKPRSTAFSYDALYRLATVSYPNHIDEAYSYDLASNRTKLETKKMKFVPCFDGWKWDEKACKVFVHCIFHPEFVTHIASYEYDKANKLLGLKETKKIHEREHVEKTIAYEFDLNGNQVKESILNAGCKKPAVNSFGFDNENHLTSAVMKGIKQYGFVYDGEGRRIQTTVGSVGRSGSHVSARCGRPEENAQVIQHLYDGSSMIMDLDAKGKVVSSYSYGLGLNAINSQSLKGYYHSDALGSITEITGKEGQAIRSYRYDAWGSMTTGENAHDSNPFRFVGAYGVRWQDSTLGLYHMGARYYQPNIGRFISQDPIRGFDEYRDYNRYIYVDNNPATIVDPEGTYGIGFFVVTTFLTAFFVYITSEHDTGYQLKIGSETTIVSDYNHEKWYCSCKVFSKEYGHLLPGVPRVIKWDKNGCGPDITCPYARGQITNRCTKTKPLW